MSRMSLDFTEMPGMSNDVKEIPGMSNVVKEECYIIVMAGRCVSKTQVYSNKTC